MIISLRSGFSHGRGLAIYYNKASHVLVPFKEIIEE